MMMRVKTMMTMKEMFERSVWRSGSRSATSTSSKNVRMIYHCFFVGRGSHCHCETTPTTMSAVDYVQNHR